MYVIGTARTGVVKIGVATDPVKRLRSIQTGSPVSLRILATVPGDATLERRLHERFAGLRRAGEWFDFGERDAVDAVLAAVDAPLPPPIATANEIVLLAWALYSEDEDFLPSEVLCERLCAAGHDEWRALTSRAGSMRLASLLGSAGVPKVKYRLGGTRQRRGYLRADLARPSVH